MSSLAETELKTGKKDANNDIKMKPVRQRGIHKCTILHT